MVRRLVIAPRAELRLREAAAWLASRPVGDEVIVIAATADGASEQIRAIAKARGAAFGFHRFTLNRLAAELAKLAQVTHNLATINTLAFEALCARVIDRLQLEGKLARLGAVADQPGLPRALARTLGELRLAGVTALDGELGAALAALDEELAANGLADRATVYRLAAEVAEAREPHLLLDRHVLMVDVKIRTAAERRLVAALVGRAPSALATVPTGDERSIVEVFGAAEELLGDGTDSLHRVQRHLFAPALHKAELDPSVHVMSAPGESRECVEIARCILAETERGVPYDRMAVLLRSPEQYRVHIEEAFARAKIQIHFDRGTRKPDPSGRALLALLACAAENLSARRFAEYVSLDELPRTIGGAPPPALRADERWVPPDEELLPLALAAIDEPVVEAAPETLRAPWRWERLLVDAAVIGGRERWERRLKGLEERIRLDDRETVRVSNARNLIDLAHLRAFAVPLLDELAALPESATWGVWIDRLARLAGRALRAPERVLAVLSSLNPMKDVGPVRLHEVQDVLHARLTDLITPPAGRRYGKVLVAAIDAARGFAFDVVFVPGLAERMFPQKLSEDPLLLDTTRTELALGLETREHRLLDERLALRLAIGAATRRVVLSYPRIDLDQGRPRVPSFYGLEVLQAAEGALPGFDELGRRADITGAARIGWPAPDDPQQAIDEAEFDLGVLDEFVGAKDAPKGPARYLLDANKHLARALRTRARRWNVKAWKATDGLVLETDAGRAALAEHQPSMRSFSPTALEALAACPYRFALKTIVRLEPREEPEPIEQLGPLEKGSLIHEVQFELLGELRAANALPVRPAALDAARDRLDRVLDRVAGEYHDKLYPAIERVWRDGIDSIRADLREWLRRMADDPAWIPRRFELAFGLDQKEGRDPASVEDPVALDIGIRLRGSIDLVEEGPAGTIRATDHKTGKLRVERGALIAGGKSLQPTLYALALERILSNAGSNATVASGRLYYCTTRGDFTDVNVPLDDDARAAAQLLGKTLAHYFEEGFFPAAPAKDECKYCDFRRVCGPYEEMRAKKKETRRLSQLEDLRKTR